VKAEGDDRGDSSFLRTRVHIRSTQYVTSLLRQIGVVGDLETRALGKRGKTTEVRWSFGQLTVRRDGGRLMCKATINSAGCSLDALKEIVGALISSSADVDKTEFDATWMGDPWILRASKDRLKRVTDVVFARDFALTTKFGRSANRGN